MIIIKLIDLIMQNCGVSGLVLIGIVAGISVIGALRGREESTDNIEFVDDRTPAQKKADAEEDAIWKEHNDMILGFWHANGSYIDRHGNRRSVYRDP